VWGGVGVGGGGGGGGGVSAWRVCGAVSWHTANAPGPGGEVLDQEVAGGHELGVRVFTVHELSSLVPLH